MASSTDAGFAAISTMLGQVMSALDKQVGSRAQYTLFLLPPLPKALVRGVGRMRATAIMAIDANMSCPRALSFPSFEMSALLSVPKTPVSSVFSRTMLWYVILLPLLDLIPTRPIPAGHPHSLTHVTHVTHVTHRINLDLFNDNLHHFHCLNKSNLIAPLTMLTLCCSRLDMTTAT